MASISCSGLSFAWPDGTVVLRDVRLSIGPGRTAWSGPNGCGKSTLLHVHVRRTQKREGHLSVETPDDTWRGVT